MMTINDLELTVRSHRALSNMGIETIEQLMGLSWEQLNSIPNAGAKSVTEICWQYMQIFNGEMNRQLAENIQLTEQRSSWKEVRKKASKYDEIIKVIEKE